MLRTMISCAKTELHNKNILWVVLFIYSFVNSMFSGDITGNSWLFVLGLLISSFQIKSTYKSGLNMTKVQE